MTLALPCDMLTSVSDCGIYVCEPEHWKSSSTISAHWLIRGAKLGERHSSVLGDWREEVSMILMIRRHGRRLVDAPGHLKLGVQATSIGSVHEKRELYHGSEKYLQTTHCMASPGFQCASTI